MEKSISYIPSTLRLKENKFLRDYFFVCFLDPYVNKIYNFLSIRSANNKDKVKYQKSLKSYYYFILVS